MTTGCIGWVVWYLFQTNLAKGETEFKERYQLVGITGICSVFLFWAYAHIHLQRVANFSKIETPSKPVPEEIRPDPPAATQTVYRSPTIAAPSITRTQSPAPTVARKKTPISPSPGWETEGQGSLPHEPKPLHIPPPQPIPKPVYQDVIGEDLDGRSEVRKVTLSPHYWYILTSSYLSSPIWFDGTEPAGARVRVRVNDGAPVNVTANSTVSLNSRMRKIAFQSGEPRDITIYITKKRSIVRAKVDSKSVLESALESVGATVSVNTATLPQTTPPPATGYSSTPTTRTFRYSTRSTQPSSSTQYVDPYSPEGHARGSSVRRSSNQATNTAPARPTRPSAINRSEPRANRNR